MLSESGPSSPAPHPPRLNVGLAKGRTSEVTLHIARREHGNLHSTLSAGEQGVCRCSVIGGTRGDDGV